MSAIVMYGFSCFAGLILLKHFVKNPLISILVSPVLGIVVSSWLFFTLALISTVKTSLYVGILILVIFSLSHAFKTKAPKINKKDILKNWELLVFLIFWTILLLPLFDSHMIKLTSDGSWQTGGSSYGDLALHISFINKFSEQPTISLQSPIFSSLQTTYPFMINFFAGLLVKTGVSVRNALLLTSFPFVLAILASTYTLLKNLTKGSKAGWIFSFLFLFNGGIGIYYLYQDWLKNKSTSIFNFLLDLQMNYSHMPDFNIRWTNIIVDYFLPQRTMLVGLSIFCLVMFLYSLLHSKYQVKLRYLIAFIIGMTPFFHIHTFLVLFTLSIWFDFWHVHLKKTDLHNTFKATFLTVILMAPQLYWQFFHTFSESFTRMYFGWMKQPNENILEFWLKNLGVSSILWLIAPVTLLKLKKASFLKIASIPLLSIFIIANFIIFQPHDFDNMKFMIFSYYGICMLSAIAFARISNISIKHSLLIFFLVLLSTTTGIVSYFRESYALYNIATDADIVVAKRIQELTDPSNIFLTADNHNHPIHMISGRSSVMVHPGWLWTHGISYQTTAEDIFEIFQGRSNSLLLLKKHNIDYVFISERELIKYRPNLSYFDSNFEKIYVSDQEFMYKIEY